MRVLLTLPQADFSKPSLALPPVYFNRRRQFLTRSQEKHIRNTFHFLSLPAELRNMVYELAVNFNGVERWFDDTYAQAVEFATIPANRGKVMTRKVTLQTPRIFLICRQVYAESIVLLAKRSVHFHHGLFTLTAIRQIMSEKALQRISSINITAKGHHVLEAGTAGATWKGYIIILKDLARILEEDHSLKSLTIDLEDPDLTHHLINCWHSAIECDYRDHVKTALNRFRPVRGIDSVTFKGIDPDFALELKNLMETKHFPFLDIPGEIRTRIYADCLDYDHVSTHISRVMQDWVANNNHSNDASYPIMSTPTVLLLNKQIYHEAKAILNKKALKITCPVDPKIDRQAKVPDLLRFVSADTIQAITRLELSVHSWEYAYAIERIFNVLKHKHSLESFRLEFHDNLKSDFLRKVYRPYPDSAIAKCFCGMAGIHGVKDVVFEGDLPGVYTEPMAKIMKNKRGGKKRTPKAIRGDGKVVDLELD